MSDVPIRCILFDLGGVLVEFRGIQRVAELLGEGAASEAHWRHWLGSGVVREFELGRLAPEEFAERFVGEFEVGVSPGALLAELDGWISDPLPGALELLDELKPGFTVACLSNTNPLHVPRMQRAFDGRFDRLYASCETGMLKPDREAFEHVRRDLGLEPDAILFFDDARLNVEAAREVGFAAVRVHGPADCRAELVRRGLLD